MSIRTKYEQELSFVFNKLVSMCRATELAIERSVTALTTRDKELARRVMAEDKDIDVMEREIEQDCLKILLMERPVAGDFRDVSAALKMITDLERIAEPEHIAEMARCAIAMVKDSVQSYINRDVAAARDLDNRDDRVDILFETIKNDLVELIRRDPSNADQAILFMMVAKYLERIGDHAVNIGEWVDYAVTGHHN